jgi:LPS sulfotransferase NodH
MAGRFDSFVMFAGMRTGSNFLEANLNALAGVSCQGELFNPHFIGRKDQLEMFGLTLAQRDADPMALLARLRRKVGGLTGFRFFHDHDPRVLAAVLADPACAKIILTRNPVDSYVSWKIAQATGQWKLTNTAKRKTAMARFDAAGFEAHLDEAQAFQMHLLHGLQTTGQTAFYLDYDDIGDLAVLRGLAAFLGVEPTLDAPDATLKRQNPEAIGEKVSNPAEMAAELARIDRFNLSRTPNFEPRRGPAIPAIQIAGGVPLMFMPLRGGPVAAVAGWLAGVGTGGLLGDMTQKEVRQWKRAHPGHRSFTVLRHPVARAHHVFCTQVLGGAMPEMRMALMRQMKIDLPPPAKAAEQGIADHRAAFIGFLGAVKQGLMGQSVLRVDPHWASQSAVLHGFAQFQSPDHVLREDRLPAALDWLCAEIGVAGAVYEAEPDVAAHSLATVWDDEVERAVRDAYQRDYLAFGFGSWR